MQFLRGLNKQYNNVTSHVWTQFHPFQRSFPMWFNTRGKMEGTISSMELRIRSTIQLLLVPTAKRLEGTVSSFVSRNMGFWVVVILTMEIPDIC